MLEFRIKPARLETTVALASVPGLLPLDASATIVATCAAAFWASKAFSAAMGSLLDLAAEIGSKLVKVCPAGSVKPRACATVCAAWAIWADVGAAAAPGEAWITAGKPAEALKAADAILKTKPADADAQNLMRKASIAQTVTKGNWDGQGNFRDKLRDEAQAVSLEQAAKVVTAGDMAQRLVDEAKARVQAEPTNLNHYRAVAQAYRQLGRSDEALVWVRKARALPNGAVDPTLEKEESELQTALLEARVKAESGDGLAAAQAELAAWRLTEAKRTVERYPNDFPARLALGELLLASGQLDAALAQFQQAQKGPQVRVAALVGLGRGFRAKKIYDLAVMQFKSAKTDLTAMDDTKKEVIYELGSCYEAMGKPEEAIAEFKAIYGEDIGYRDVADKITAFYSK